MRNQYPLETLWAVLSVDPDGNEGICGMIMPVPGQMVTGSENVRELFRESAPTMMGPVLAGTEKIVLATFTRVRADDEPL